MDAALWTCPDCTDSRLVTDGGVTYCAACGIVVDDNQLEHSEPVWRDAEHRRLGPQQSNQWLNTGTKISWEPSGNAERLIRYNERLTSSERSLASGLHELRNLAASIELPTHARERASYWYRQAVQERLLKGRSIEAFAAACVFIAARERRYPITLSTLATVSPVTESKIRNHLRVLQATFDVTLPPAHPRDFLPKIVSDLDLSVAVERQAARYLEHAAAEEVHVGKHPAAVAATAIYAATKDLDSEQAPTQQTIADAADVSPVTISRHYQDLQALIA